MGLSLRKQSSWAVSAVNSATGEIVQIDPGVARLGRMRKRVTAWAKAVEELWRSGGVVPVMVTLTYRPGVEWRAGDIRDFMIWARRVMGCGLLAAAWVAELQARGAVHYHVLLVCRRGRLFPKPDRAGGWCHGFSKVERARKPWYLVKYSQKGGGVEFPKGLRLFSVTVGQEAIGEAALWEFRRSVLPKWLCEAIEGEQGGGLPKRAQGGGWRFRGQDFKSPWRVQVWRV